MFDNKNNLNLLSYREWSREHIGIVFEKTGNARVFCLHTNTTYLNTINPGEVSDLKNGIMSPLLKVWKDKFEWIQKNWPIWKKRLEKVS